MCHLHQRLKSLTFGTPEIAKLLGETIHKTISYVNRGYLQPSVQDARGHGSKRLWNYSDLTRFFLIKMLRDFGLSVQRVREIMIGITDCDLQPDRIWSLWTTGETKIHRTGDDVDSAYENNLRSLGFDADCPGQLLVPMDALHKQIEASYCAKVLSSAMKPNRRGAKKG